MAFLKMLVLLFSLVLLPQAGLALPAASASTPTSCHDSRPAPDCPSAHTADHSAAQGASACCQLPAATPPAAIALPAAPLKPVHAGHVCLPVASRDTPPPVPPPRGLV
ncbi:hypothetical protein [Gulbenkiania mobilis]|uniref:hypothetical protein n=1 Tax=Gulbenkiania mobilis TaxID=397457 RepID=UPI0006BBE814|nr:hypothetical protein [Gulbenkiania mobilis]